MLKEPYIEYLVVDTSSFLNNSSYENIGKNVVTIQEVVNEIKSKSQIRRMVVLPYDLKVKDVFTESIQHVTEFSKKTGDYPSLSSVDIKVIALTYQLEKEHVGTEHLKIEPVIQKTVNLKNPYINDEESEKFVGFYLPSKQKSTNCKSGDSKTEDLSENFENSCGLEAVCEKLTECNSSENNFKQVEQFEKYDDDDGDKNCSVSDDDDDDCGWITPENITALEKEYKLKNEENKPIVVACSTADFAMQNVLKQMGLNLVSPYGKMIHKLSTYILRCYSCFKTTGIMTKIFCPHCGNKTLKRVSYTLNDDGTQEINIYARKAITAKGKNVSLPQYKGGKYSINPWLVEDQPMPKLRPSKLSCMKNNPMDPDYIAGYSPFLLRDVSSRSAMMGIYQNSLKNLVRNSDMHRIRGKKK